MIHRARSVERNVERRVQRRVALPVRHGMLLGLVAVFAAACASAPVPLGREGEYTVSTEAQLVERSSASEWLIEATGIFRSDREPRFRARGEVRRVGVERALLDARRVAIWYVLFGGTDPFLRSDEEKNRFHRRADEVLAAANVRRYISFEETAFTRNLLIEDGRGRRVSKRFTVNVEMLRRDLEAQGIIASRAQLAEQLGLPFIMVVAATQPGDDLFARLRAPDIRHGATVVESFLTNRGYDVVVPEQTAVVADLAQATLEARAAGAPSAERSSDAAYLLALSVGSDIYITVDGSQQSAANNTSRYAQQVRAFETTTGRLLGSETGFSRARQGDLLVSVEEATIQAVDNVLARLTNYWEEDLRRGVQYKVVISVDPRFNDRQAEDIHFTFLDALEDLGRSSRELVVTKETLDYLIWVDPQRYNNATRVFRRIRDEFEGRAGFLLNMRAELRSVTTNRKLVVLRLERT